MNGGDVRVMGLVMGTHMIEDIRMDVPHGMIVSIPAEQAAISRDLWRAISQKCLFQLPSTPAPSPSAPPPRLAADVERIRVLEERVQLLERENTQLREALQTSQVQQGKLDRILTLLQSGGIAVVDRMEIAPNAPRPALAPTVNGEAPQFIPAEIRPKEVSVHIEDAKGETVTSGVSDAAEQLRKLRKAAPQ